VLGEGREPVWICRFRSIRLSFIGDLEGTEMHPRGKVEGFPSDGKDSVANRNKTCEENRQRTRLRIP
jgi:hypothetical protein